MAKESAKDTILYAMLHGGLREKDAKYLLREHDRQVRSDERRRIAADLRHYFEDGPSTFRGLLEYLHLEYMQALDEGWLDFNNAVFDYEERVKAQDEQT